MIRLVLDVKQPAVNGCHGWAESVRPPTVVAFKLRNNLDDAVVRGSRLNNLHAWDLVCSEEGYGDLGFGLLGRGIRRFRVWSAWKRDTKLFGVWGLGSLGDVK